MTLAADLRQIAGYGDMYPKDRAFLRQAADALDAREAAADEIVVAIWSDLTGRSGFDVDIDIDTPEEIRSTWRAIILNALPPEPEPTDAAG